MLSAWAQNPANPIQDGLLRWYPANTVSVIAMGSGCTGPQTLVFDGAHMWVGCDGYLEEINTSDGTVMQQVSLGSGFLATRLLYDGANIWVANSGADTVAVFQASNGSKLGTVTLENEMQSMAFDGQYVWIVDAGGVLTQVQLSAGVPKTVSSNSIANCSGPQAIAAVSSDLGSPANGASSLWVVCGSAPDLQVVELNANGGYKAATTASIGATPYCENIAFDGRNIWFTSETGPDGNQDLIAVDTQTLKVSYLNLGATIKFPGAVAFDGIYMWVNSGTSSVTKFLVPSSPLTAGALPSSGTASYTNGGASSSSWIAFDGGNIWVATPAAKNSSGLYTVSKM